MIRPKLRPKDFNPVMGGSDPKPSNQTKSGSKDKGSKKSVDISTKAGREKVLKSQQDKSYGYYDGVTGEYVPWYIDIQNGGGMNTAGDEFKSPFEGTPMMLPLQMMTAAANKIPGITPYGSQRERAFMPMEAQRGALDAGAYMKDFMNTPNNLGPAPGGNGGGAATPPPGVPSPKLDGKDFMFGSPLSKGNPAQSYSSMPMGEMGRGTPRPKTGSSDAPPGLLPMTPMSPTPALSDLRMPMQYSGRGVVGMMYPDFVKTEEQKKVVDYLRSVGAIDY